MPIFKMFTQFQTFKDPALEKMVSGASGFVHKWRRKEPPIWLCLLGSSGVGKTFLCDLVREETAEKLKASSGDVFLRKWPKYKWADLASIMKSGEWECARYIHEQPCFIDDIGAEHDPSKAVAAELGKVLDKCLGQWVLITSNLSVRDIAEKLDPRIADRMLRNGNIVVETKATSFSVRNRK